MPTNDRFTPPWYPQLPPPPPPPPWWAWYTGVDPTPPYFPPWGVPPVATRDVLSPADFPNATSTPVVTPRPASPAGGPTVANNDALRTGLKLASTMLARAAQDIAAQGGTISERSRVLMATGSGFVAGALAAQGQSVGVEYLNTIWNQSESPDASALAGSMSQLAALFAGASLGTRRWPTWEEVKAVLCGLAAGFC